MFEYKAVVDKVIDGDTVDVTVDLGFKIGCKLRIRLARIDAPERGIMGYIPARVRLEELVLGKPVRLKTEKISKWGYYLGTLYTEAGLDVNQFLLDEGLVLNYAGGAKPVPAT